MKTRVYTAIVVTLFSLGGIGLVLALTTCELARVNPRLVTSEFENGRTPRLTSTPSLELGPATLAAKSLVSPTPSFSVTASMTTTVTELRVGDVVTIYVTFQNTGQLPIEHPACIMKKRLSDGSTTDNLSAFEIQRWKVEQVTLERVKTGSVDDKPWERAFLGFQTILSSGELLKGEFVLEAVSVATETLQIGCMGIALPIPSDGTGMLPGSRVGVSSKPIKFHIYADSPY